MTIDHMQIPESRSRNAFIAIFICMAAGIILAGILHCRRFKAHYRVEIGRELSAVAGLKADQIKHYHETQLNLASLFVDNPSFSGLLGRYFADPSDQDAKKRLLGWIGRLKDSGSFDRIRLLDARGATRLSVPPSLPTITPFIARHAAETMRAGRAGFSGFYRNAHDGRIYLSLEAPILDANSGRGPLGTLVLRTDPLTYLYPMMLRWPTTSLTAETQLVGRDGNDALFLSPARFQADAALKMRIPLSRTDVPAVRAVLGRTGVAEGIDYRGVRVLADTRAIPGSPWFLVSRIDIAEAAAPLKKHLWLISAFVAVLLAVTGAALAFIWKQRSAAFYRERYEAMGTLRESEERLTAITESANDAILTMDPGGRVSYWNRAAQAIFGYTKEEALGRDLHELLTPRRYRAAQSAALSEFHRTGRGAALGVPQELKALRKGGEEFDVSLSLSAVRLGDEWHAVGIVQDITERKKAEHALLEARNIIERSPAVAFLWKNEAGWPVEFVSTNVETLFGYTAEDFTSGRAMYSKIIHPEDLSRVGEEVVRNSAEKGRKAFTHDPYRIFTKDGQVKWVNDSTVIRRDKKGEVTHYQGIIIDITARKKSEEALLESNEKINLLLNSASEAIYGIDRDGNCNFCNAACLRLLGYKRPEELLGKNMHWQIHSKHQDGTPFPIEECRIFNAFIKGEEARVDDEVLWRSDGTSFPAEYWSYPQLHNGEVVGAVISFFDITERRKSEEALRQSESINRAILNAIPDLIFRVNRGGVFLDYRAKHESDLFAPPDAIIGKNIREIIPPDFCDLSLRHIQKALESAKVQVFEYSLPFASGLRDFEARMSASGVDEVVAIIRDITERKKAEQELHKLSMAVTESPASIVITDVNGTIEYVNRRFTEVTGYSSEEAVGQNPRILKSGEQSAEFYLDLWETLLSGSIWRGDFHNKKKNGQLYWESAAIAPITDAGGRITNYLAVKEDITRSKRLETELIKAKDAAETANRAKSTFLANMSHEIRTPMNAILGFSQLMRRDPAATPKQRQQIETINRSGEHLLALINDILEMSKAEAGRTTLNPTAFDLCALIDDVENMLRPHAVAKGLQLAVERGTGLPRYVTADEGKLRQVLLNLLGNALKFTVKGAVTLRVGIQPGAERDFSLTAEVEDTGPGINPQELAALFRPFEQAQAGRAAGGGTGLGLAISREYVRLMGGDITVKSQPGKGSVFSFNIALKEASQEAPAPKAQPRQVKGLKPGQPQYRVLVADDKEDNREFLAQLLGPAGFEVRQAADGEAALKEFEAWQPQLILMDLQMPVLDGYEAMRRIRAGAGGRGTKIIAVTADTFGEAGHKALDAGADAVIIKPFRESELFEKIQNLLGAEYIYEEEAPAAIAGPADTGMLKSALAGLPRELISQLRKAVNNGDFDRLAELAGQVETHNISLAGMLRGLAGEFDLQGILALLAKEMPHDR